MGGPAPQSSLTSYTHSYTYDALNRLTGATDTGGWSRNFAYDQYGNGWVTAASGIATGPATPGPGIYNTKNQIGSSPYDAAGNMTALPPGMTYSYDAENRITSEANSGGLSASYYYDADGKRVKKALSNGETVVYIYDALGNLAAEYGSTLSGAPPCTTCYLSYDHLGSVRMVTDQNANVISRHDYLPFGEEIPGGVAGRSGQFGASDGVSQRFTGKERDSEASLDYFGARYYGAGVERFISRDEPLADQDAEDPQSWNLYSYVRNNPLRNVDRDGRTCPFAKDDQGRTVINNLDGKGCAQLYDSNVYADEPGLMMLAGIGENLTNPHNWAQLMSDASRAAASVIAPGASAIAECITPGGSCSTTNLLAAAVGLTPAEKKIFEELIAAGHDVQIIPRASGQTADFVVDGVATELKTLTTVGANTLKNAIEDAATQGEHILVDARNVNIDAATASQQIERAQGNVGNLQGRVTVLTKEGPVTF